MLTAQPTQALVHGCTCSTQSTGPLGHKAKVWLRYSTARRYTACDGPNYPVWHATAELTNQWPLLKLLNCGRRPTELSAGECTQPVSTQRFPREYPKATSSSLVRLWASSTAGHQLPAGTAGTTPKSHRTLPSTGDCAVPLPRLQTPATCGLHTQQAPA